MKTVVGFVFTETYVQRLMNEGFLFKCNELSTVNGYREFICPLSSQLGSGQSIEIREILDENIYFQFQKNKSFSPFESICSTVYAEVDHKNDVYFAEGVLGDEMPEGELKEYFKIRKKYPIWALWLKCHNLELFTEIAKPEQYFIWDGKKAALIHLGQSCFDLLVTEA